MGKAWPRFLPSPTVEAIAHALIIEAPAIVVAQLGEGYDDLFQAHNRAEAFARAHYSEGDLRKALHVCTAFPSNEDIPLHHVTHFLPAEIKIGTRISPALRVTAPSNNKDHRPARIRQPHRTRHRPSVKGRPAFAAQA